MAPLIYVSILIIAGWCLLAKPGIFLFGVPFVFIKAALWGKEEDVGLYIQEIRNEWREDLEQILYDSKKVYPDLWRWLTSGFSD